MRAADGSADTRGLRLIAVFELGKGTLVVAAAIGLMFVGQARMEHLVDEAIALLHLDPRAGAPHLVLSLAHDASDDRLRWLAIGAVAYAAVRIVEGYGLWRGRSWAEWLAVVSVSLYLPFEVFELARGLSLLKLATFAGNLVVLGYVGRALFRATARRARAAPR